MYASHRPSRENAMGDSALKERVSRADSTGRGRGSRANTRFPSASHGTASAASVRAKSRLLDRTVLSEPEHLLGTTCNENSTDISPPRPVSDAIQEQGPIFVSPTLVF